MRDLMVLCSMLVFVPFALSNAFAAFLLWGWTAVIGLNSYIYSYMKSVPFNMIFAIIAIASIALGRDSLRAKFRFPATSTLMLLLALQGTVSVIFAFDGLPYNVELYSNLVKAIIFCIFMPWVLTQRYRIHAFVVVITLGLAFHGLIEGLKFIASGGGHRIQGLSKFGDNNHFAIVIIMGIPLLLFLYRYSSHRLMRLAALGAAALSVSAVIATHSRGGFLSLTAVVLWAVLCSRRKALGLGLLGIGLVALVAMAPASWTERMETIREADHDTSFMSRVVAWKASSAIALDRPLTGGGFHAVQAPQVWSQYRYKDGLLVFVDTPYRPITAFAAHSIYFEILGDLGFIGLTLFLALLANTFVIWWKIRRLASKAGAGAKWAADLANMLAASMFGYVVGAAALSLAYLEVMYALAMLMQVLLLFLKDQGRGSIEQKHPIPAGGIPAPAA